jgi:CDP-diacylglycerol--serine O-phosphatidyltransferase
LALAGLFIIIASVFDFFDGMSARLLKAYSPMGKELDSLADVISFGIAPAVIAMLLIKPTINPNGVNVTGLSFPIMMVQLFPLILVVFSALRLAKFNIDTRQTESFIGLPTPGNALLWASLPLMLFFSHGNNFLAGLLSNPWVILPLSAVMSFLLVSEIPMFSLKFKSLKPSQNKTRFIFLAICLLLIIFFQIASIPLIILTYVQVSVIDTIVFKKQV